MLLLVGLGVLCFLIFLGSFGRDCKACGKRKFGNQSSCPHCGKLQSH